MERMLATNLYKVVVQGGPRDKPFDPPFWVVSDKLLVEARVPLQAEKMDKKGRIALKQR